MLLDLTYKETWLHRINPAFKLLTATILLVVMLFVHNLNYMLNATCAMALLLCFTGHPWKRVLLFCSPFLLVFVSTAATMAMFGEGETTWVRWGLSVCPRKVFSADFISDFERFISASSGLCSL